MKIKLIYILLGFLLVFQFACDETVNEPTPIETGDKGLVILNEGLYGLNNSSMSYYNFSDSSVSQYVYRNANNDNRLGDTGNDMVAYGDNLLIAVDKSNKLEVLNKKTFERVRMIDLGVNGSPREILLIDSLEAYVTSAFKDIVFKLNPTTGEILSTVSVGSKPEGIAVANEKIYVANSGFVFGTTVSVISRSSFTTVEEITVGQNPRYIVTDSHDNVYVVCSGKWDNNGKGGIYKIDCNTDTIVDSLIMFKNPGEACLLNDDTMLVVNAEGIYRIDTATLEQTEMIIASEKINDATGTIYSIFYDSEAERLFCGNSKDNTQDGEVVIIDLNGGVHERIPCGLNPGTFLTIYN